jgi:hypothetical protein
MGVSAWTATRDRWLALEWIARCQTETLVIDDTDFKSVRFRKYLPNPKAGVGECSVADRLTAISWNNYYPKDTLPTNKGQPVQFWQTPFSLWPNTQTF